MIIILLSQKNNYYNRIGSNLWDKSILDIIILVAKICNAKKFYKNYFPFIKKKKTTFLRIPCDLFQLVFIKI